MSGSSLPEDVSPVFQNLKNYVDIRYGHADEAIKRVIFSVAYTGYCEEKKEAIKKRIELFNPSLGSVHIKRMYKEFDTDEKFLKYCDGAEQFLKHCIDEDVRDLMQKAAKEMEPSFVKLVSVHFLVTIIAGVLALVVFPIIAILSGFAMPIDILHKIGGWFVKLGDWLVKL